jgi:hypothetical protein
MYIGDFVGVREQSLTSSTNKNCNTSYRSNTSEGACGTGRRLIRRKSANSAVVNCLKSVDRKLLEINDDSILRIEIFSCRTVFWYCYFVNA